MSINRLSTNQTANVLRAAVVSGTTGTVSVSSPYTEGGFSYVGYKWTTDGSVTLSQDGLVDLCIVGGGSNPGATACGGGAAGGMLVLTQVHLAAGTHTIKVGAGGAAAYDVNSGMNGEPSRLGPYLVAGGNSGADRTTILRPGQSSGTGGSKNPTLCTGGAGLAPYGNAGGNGNTTAAGGGGGAGAAGSNASGTTGGAGGAGLANTFANGSSVTYAGGGGGGGDSAGGAGGAGGGGAGAIFGATGTAGTANTGGGAGGSGGASPSAAGGSGVVILRVKV